MRRVLQKICTLFITLMFIFTFSTNAYANSDYKEREYLENYTKVLNAIKEEVLSHHKFGDVTADFLEEMIIHNQGASYMSENVLKYGSDKKVREIAKSIIRSQIDTVTEMSAILDIMEENLKIDKSKETEYIKKYDEIIENMLLEMDSTKYTGNIDKHYLKSMNSHKEASLKMIKNILNYTEDKAVKKLIIKIEKSSYKQIKEIKKLLEVI